MSCLACAQAHLINPKTGKMLGSRGRLDLRPFPTVTSVSRSPDAPKWLPQKSWVLGAAGPVSARGINHQRNT